MDIGGIEMSSVAEMIKGLCSWYQMVQLGGSDFLGTLNLYFSSPPSFPSFFWSHSQ